LKNKIKTKGTLKPVTKSIMSSAVETLQKYNTRSAKAQAGASKTDTSKTETSKTETVANKPATNKIAASKTPEAKPHESSDDEDDDEDDDEETDEEETDTDEETDEDISDDEEDRLADQEYKKFLSELFPSEYMTERALAAMDKSSKKCPMAPKKSRRDSIEEDAGSSQLKNPMKNFNISFIIGDPHRQADDEYMSATEALYDETYSDTEDEAEISKKKEKKPEETADDNAAFTKMKGLFESLSPAERENPIIKKMLDDITKKEKSFLKKAEQKSKKQKVENTKKLKTLLRERDVMNDLQYFNEKMSIAEQENALRQIEEIKKHNDITKPYRLTLLDADIPSQFKAIAYRKISSLRSMEPGGGDYYKMKNWVDTFMQIPFGKYKNLPITIADGVEKCHEFMDNAKHILDQAVYGLNDAKLQIMQMVGQWIVNPSAIGTAIAIKGPMGTGKTTLVKEGISKILGRDFVFIALGGATDSSFLEGHSYTYEGSTWGKIVDLLIKCKSMNPVIYFDELDKISDTPKGEEIAGILTHLTDTAQNNQFHDRYFSEIEFDLSRCLFIFSYNDESKVNKILLDRMYRIQTQGYNQEQKTTISNKYLLPKICDQVKFQTQDITISDETLHYIITNYTDKEDGVRTLKRCLEIIYTKLNLYRLMRPDTNIFESEMSIKVEFPMQVTTAIVDKLIKKVVDSGSWHNMYM